jgi:hypothetical protein
MPKKLTDWLQSKVFDASTSLHRRTDPTTRVHAHAQETQGSLPTSAYPSY